MRLISLAVILVMFAAFGRADVVYLKNGKVVEGRVREDGDRVIVEIAYGTISFPKDKVARIERSKSNIEEYDSRYAALEKGDVKSRLALANWCQSQGLGGRREDLYREILTIDSDNAEARKQLGYMRHQGAWITPEQKYLALGMIKFEGQWHTPESVADIKKARAAAKQAEDERRKAELELEIRRTELVRLRAERARIEAERAQLAEERRRLERLLISYPHFKVIGNAIYYYPDYPTCRKGVVIFRSQSVQEIKKQAEEDRQKEVPVIQSLTPGGAPRIR